MISKRLTKFVRKLRSEVGFHPLQLVYKCDVNIPPSLSRIVIAQLLTLGYKKVAWVINVLTQQSLHVLPLHESS